MKNYLVTIGISRYADNNIVSLNTPAHDSLSLKKVFVEKYQFTQENAITLLNEDATRYGILRLFDELGKKISSKDNLVFYYSGHTWINSKRNEECILPFDSEHTEIEFTSISFHEVIRELSSFQCKNILFIVDGLFSGNVQNRITLNFNNIWILMSGISPVNTNFTSTLLEVLSENDTPEYSISLLILKLQLAIEKKGGKVPQAIRFLNIPNSQTEMRLFARNYKKPDVNIRLSKIDKSFFSICKIKSDYEKYINHFPNGKMIEEATQKIRDSAISYIPKIKNEISNGNTKAAIEAFLNYCSLASIDDKSSIIFSSRYSQLEYEYSLGLISFESYRMELTKIQHGLLIQIGRIEKDENRH